MPALVIGGVTVAVVRPPTGTGVSWSLDAEGGALARGLSGRQGGAVRWQKRAWRFLTAPMTPAAAAALRTAAPVGQIVTCSGDVLGGTVTGVVTITERTFGWLDGGAHDLTLTLTLREA